MIFLFPSFPPPPPSSSSSSLSLSLSLSLLPPPSFSLPHITSHASLGFTACKIPQQKDNFFAQGSNEQTLADGDSTLNTDDVVHSVLLSHQNTRVAQNDM